MMHNMIFSKRLTFIFQICLTKIRPFTGGGVVASALLTLLFMIAIVDVHAGGKEDLLKVVKKVKGVGIAIDGDFVTAEKVAIINAKIAAIEKAVGVQIDSGAVVIDSALADSWMEKFSNGVVSDYTLRKKKVNERKGVVTVWIDAVVKKALLPKDGVKWWEKMKSDLSVMVLLDENWQPAEGVVMKPVEIKAVQPYIEDVLTRNKYTVLSGATVKKIMKSKQLHDAVTVRQLVSELSEMKMFTSLSIGGKINSRFNSRDKHMTWYHSEYDIGLIDTDTAHVVKSFMDWTKGAGSQDTIEMTNRQAYENSVNSARERIADQVLAALDEMIGEHFNREVVVEVQGLPDFKRHQWFIDILKNTDWVELPKERVDKRFYDPESSRIPIMYKEKSYFLAFKLDSIPGLEVIETRYNKIVVRYVEK
jgi:hypothetical protein